MNPFERTDKIDAYLDGTMESSAKNEFERLLSSSNDTLEENNLQKEMEMQKKLILAIQKNAMEETIKAEEKRIRRKQHISRIADRIMLFSAIVGVAACLAGYFILTPMVQHVTSYGVNEFVDYSNTSGAFIIRGNEENMDLLADAIDAMSVKDWKKAETNLDAVIFNTINTDDEQLAQIGDEAKWLKAIVSMQRGRYFIAKKQLQEISNSNSIYAEQAKTLLLELKK